MYLKQEWRANRNNFVWGLPSGVIETGEAPEACAQRELQEEVGVKAGRITKLTTVYPTNHVRAQFHFFLAEALSPSALKGDDDEYLEVAVLPFDEAYVCVVKEQTPTMQDALAFELVKNQ